MPRSLRIVDDLATRVENPLQLHERTTVTRWLTRSVRASVASSVVAVPAAGGPVDAPEPVPAAARERDRRPRTRRPPTSPAVAGSERT